jgi:hypothetical protein
MTIEGYSIHSASEFVGKELGVTDWVVIDQGRIEIVQPVFCKS